MSPVTVSVNKIARGRAGHCLDEGLRLARGGIGQLSEQARVGQERFKIVASPRPKRRHVEGDADFKGLVFQRLTEGVCASPLRPGIIVEGSRKKLAV